MTTHTRAFRALLAIGTIWATACGGAVEPNTGGPAAPVSPEPGPSAPACVSGSTKQVDCNTCSCDGGEWTCTLLGCATPTPVPTPKPTPKPTTCKEGDGQPSGDGCNSCSCAGGEWACTALYCGPIDPPDASPPSAACPDPRKSSPDEVCAGIVVWSKNPQTKTCCKYASPCQAPKDWSSYNSEAACN